MRALSAALVCGLPALAASQTGLSAQLPSLSRILQNAGVPLDPLRRGPGQGVTPSGFPGLGPKDPRTPQAPNADENRLRLLSADKFARVGDIVRLTGNVHCQFRGYDLFAGYIEGNVRTEVFTLTGGATAIGPDAVVVGEVVELDFRNGTFRAERAEAELRPSLLQNRTVDDVYVWGREAAGTEREVHTHDGGLTTCNLDEPHFRFDSRHVVVRPGRRAILRDTVISALGNKLIRIPYLSIPLDRRRERYQPEVGRTRETGYFIKTLWGIPSPGRFDVDGYLDYFEKLGLGYGGRVYFGGSTGEGFVRIYGIAGQSPTLELTSGLVQDIGRSHLTVETNYQRRNFFNAPENTTLAIRSLMLIPQNRATTRLQYSRNSNESASFSSVQQTFGISDQRTFSDRFQTLADVRWTSSTSSFGTTNNERQQIDLRLRGQYDLRRGLAEIEYLRSIPVGEVESFFSASDRTPVLSIKSDSQRLFGEEWRRYPRITTELSVGEFANPGAQGRVTRTFFDMSVARPDEGGGRVGVGLLGRFRQGVYSDDTALYALTFIGSLRYNLGPGGAFNVRYNRLKPAGFTPLSIDRIGKTDLLTSDLTYKPFRGFTIRAGSGYDFLVAHESDRTGWQPVNVGFEWSPNRTFLFRGQSTFDPFRELWSNHRYDLAWAGGETYVSFGARYDGTRKKWGNVNFFVDALRIGRTKITALGNYNGFLEKFEAIQYSLIYDLHCWEAVLQVTDSTVGFRPGREIYFFFRLKAFPYDGAFGTGRRGQPIGTGTGSGF